MAVLLKKLLLNILFILFFSVFFNLYADPTLPVGSRLLLT